MLANDERVAKDATETFINRFVVHYTPSTIIELLRDTSIQKRVVGMTHISVGCTWWITISYHPAVFEAVGRAVASINRDPALRSLLGYAAPGWNEVQLRVDWSNRLNHMSRAIQRMNTMNVKKCVPRIMEVGWGWWRHLLLLLF